ncbi:MAG TPA: copper resistance CopC family protein [Nitrospirota bacterium]|nr:copper resistance CopC family protein [Nitrospirota bacterium]
MRNTERLSTQAASALLFIALAFTVILPDTARAHAYPDHADPKVGSTVTASPERIRVWFDSALEPAFSSIMVHAADGAMVDKRDGRVDQSDPSLLEVSVPSLPPGKYRVYWSVVARDGHRTSGDYTFTIK